MKIPKEVKGKFLDEFSDKEFTLNEVMEFLSPHIKIDAQKAIEQQAKNISRNFIASFKDGNGVRHFFSFKAGDSVKYVYSTGKLDLDVAKSILRNLNSKQKGLYKASKKIRKKIRIMYGQMSFDSLKAGAQ